MKRFKKTSLCYKNIKRRFSKTKKMWQNGISFFTTLLFSLWVSATPVLAEALNVTPIKESIGSFGAILQGFASPICIIMFIVSGLAMMTGQQGRQWAKPAMLWAGIGLMVTTFAPNIVDSLYSSFANT